MFFKVTNVRTLSKYLLIAVLLVIVVFSGLYLFSDSVRGESLPQNAKTKEQREAFIKELGYSLEQGFKEEEKTVEIPYKFSDVYEQYNALQKKAGYDLKEYGGKKVKLYTLKLSDKSRNDLYAHLLVYEDSIIGGDISAIAFKDGYMLPITK